MNKEELAMERDELIEEISKRRKKICMLGTITIFLAGAVCALFVLDKKEKISMSDLEDMVKDNVKKYTDKYMDKVKKFS